METGPVKFREWSLWAVAFVTFSGISLDNVRGYIRLMAPWLGWMVASVSVPWLAVVIGGLLTVSAAYRFGRKNAVPPKGQQRAIEPVFDPDAIQQEIIRALRFRDREVFLSELTKMVRGQDAGISAREVELSVADLVRKRWVDARQAWSGYEYEAGFLLGNRGMEYARAKGFKHAEQG